MYTTLVTGIGGQTPPTFIARWSWGLLRIVDTNDELHHEVGHLIAREPRRATQGNEANHLGRMYVQENLRQKRISKKPRSQEAKPRRENETAFSVNVVHYSRGAEF